MEAVISASHFSKDQKAIAPLLLLENRAFGFVVGCDLHCSGASLSLIRLSSSSAFELSSCNVAKDN